MLFAASYNDTVFVSQDKGNTWSPRFAYQMSGNNIASLLADSGKIFAGTYWGVLYVSDDNCITWQQVTNGIYHNEVKAISKIGNNLIIATGGGIYQSNNEGSSWFRTDTGLAAAYVYDLFIDGQNIFAASEGNGVSISTDGGETWSYPDSAMASQSSQAVVVKNNSVFAGGTEGILYSSNYGISWIPKNNGLGSSPSHLSSLVATANGILASSSFGGGLNYSNNNGNYWSTITSGITDYSIERIAVNGDTAFICTYNDRIFRSTDGGINWLLVYDSCCFPATAIWAIAISGNKVAAATNRGVLVSHDMGDTWATANNGLWQNCVSIAALGSNLWAGTGDGVYFSNDFGANWTPNYTGMDTAKWVNCFAFDSTYIYAGASSGGMWKRRLSDFPSGIAEISRISNALLYPNPFAVKATLSIDEYLKNATVTIYDLFGRQVKQLTNLTGKLFIIHRDNLSNGIYFLRLTENNQVIATRKIVISPDR